MASVPIDPLPASRTGRPATWLARGIVAVTLLVFVATGFRGLDFGRHWDEPLLLQSVAASLQNRLLLPTGIANYDDPQLAGGDYEYPTLLYWVMVGSAAPEIISDPAGLSPPTAAAAFVRSREYGLRVRRACLLISSLAVVWTYAAAGRVTRRPVVAAVAAAAVGTSWQFAYHARYIATDAILAQWAALCLALCLAAVTAAANRRRWVTAAAVVAGLATATKYPGGLLAVPVLAAGWVGGDRCRSAIPRSFGLLGVQAVTFVVVTPGAVLQPWNFLAWVRFDRYHYGTLGHFGHTIRGPVAHGMAMLEYVGLTLASPATAASAVAFSLAVVGGVVLVFRKRWASAAVLVAFPVLYVGYFSGQVAMLVRNLLVLGPFLATLGAVGLDRWLAATAGRRWGTPARWVTVAAVVIALGYDAAWLSSAAAAGRRPVVDQLSAAGDYLVAHPDLAVYPTERVAAATGLPLIPTRGTRPVVLAFDREDGDTAAWPANVPGLVRQSFGSLAYDVDYAPDWLEDALLVLDADGPAAAARRCPVAQVERAVARIDAVAGAPADFAVGPVLVSSGPDPVAAGGLTLASDAVGAVYFYRSVGIPAPGPANAWVGRQRLAFTAAGLDAGRAYQIGWSAWDHGADAESRVESAWAESTDGAVHVELRPPTPVARWPLPHGVTQDHPLWWPPRAPTMPAAPACVTVPPAVYRDGRFRLVLRRDAGPDVTASTVWVYVGPPTR